MFWKTLHSPDAPEVSTGAAFLSLCSSHLHLPINFHLFKVVTLGAGTRRAVDTCYYDG